MPYKPKKPCTYSGCSKLTTGGPCPEHKRKINRQYDKLRDESPERQFLHSTQWRAIREMKLAQDPLCERCLKDNLTVAAILVHHKDRNQRNNEPENLESCCQMHHEEIHKKERFRR